MKSDKIKVLHLINTFSVGGAEMHLLSLVKALPRDHFDITVAFFKEEAQEAASLIPDFEALGITPVNLDMPQWHHAGALLRLYLLLRKGAFDIVHTHLFRADVFGSILAKLASVPVVITTVHNTEPFFHTLPVQLVLRAVNRTVDLVIAISAAVKRSLVEQIRIPASKIHIVPYGFDLDRSQTGFSADGASVRSRLGIPLEATVIGTVGRLAKQKGHRFLIQAFAQVGARHPNTRLLIVGHDDEGLRSDLESLAKRLGVERKVFFTGFMDGREALSAMDLFVLPSLWEGFGLVLLEAMAAGLPIIATRVTAVPEIIKHKETGLLTAPKDSSGLAKQIRYLLEHPDVSSALGCRAQEQVVEKFSVSRMVTDTVQLYEDCLRVVATST